LDSRDSKPDVDVDADVEALGDTGRNKANKKEVRM
jgi:hypothetical protein